MQLGLAALERLVDADVFAPVEIDVFESHLDELAHGVELTGGNDVVARLILLHDSPHRLDVVACVSPVTLGIEIAEHELYVAAGRDRRDAVCNLARKEVERPARRLVVVEDAAARVQSVTAPVRAD